MVGCLHHQGGSSSTGGFAIRIVNISSRLTLAVLTRSSRGLPAGSTSGAKRISCTYVPTDSDCRIRVVLIESHYPAGMTLDAVVQHPIALVEFPADDPEQALRFWAGVLGVDLQQREAGEGEGWQTHSGQTELGVHRRGAGPGDRFSLPYFSVPDLSAALRRVQELGGSVIHPRPPWAICRDSEGNPFALMAAHQRQQAQ
jgi:predicted enzyme related to lactoylglutathione lyase